MIFYMNWTRLTAFALLSCILLLSVCAAPIAFGLEAEPAVTATEFLIDPEAAVEKADAETQALVVATQTTFWERLWQGAAGVGLALLTVAKFLPGWYGVVARGAHALLAPRATKEAQRYQAVTSAGFHSLVGVIEKVPNTGNIGELKSKIKNKLPSEVIDAINAYVEKLEHQPALTQQAPAANQE